MPPFEVRLRQIFAENEALTQVLMDAWVSDRGLSTPTWALDELRVVVSALRALHGNAEVARAIVKVIGDLVAERSTAIEPDHADA